MLKKTFPFLNMYYDPLDRPRSEKTKAACRTHVFFRERAFVFIVRVWTRAVHVRVGRVVVFLF